MSVDKRIDGSLDDELLEAYIRAAESYIKNAVGADEGFYADNDLFDVAVIALASSYYTERTALSSTQLYPVNLTLNSIIGQLRGKFSEVAQDGETNQSS